MGKKHATHNINQKNGVDILISEKLGFKTRNIKGVKRDVTMIKELINQEEIKILNGYVPNN